MRVSRLVKMPNGFTVAEHGLMMITRNHGWPKATASDTRRNKVDGQPPPLLKLVVVSTLWAEWYAGRNLTRFAPVVYCACVLGGIALS